MIMLSPNIFHSTSKKSLENGAQREDRNGMIPQNPDEWLRLLGVVLKKVVEDTVHPDDKPREDAEVTFHGRTVEPYDVFMSIDVLPSAADDEEEMKRPNIN